MQRQGCNIDKEVRRVRREIRSKGIKGVLVGLSGGADSMLAFHILRLASAGMQDFRLGVAHANFTLRGDESLRDEEFVRTLLERYPEIEKHFIRFDTKAYCASHGISIEMGARELRHRWFDALCKEHGYQRIVTGHNADDNEETLLLNLMRGSGTRGLRGMSADNGRVLRPLLYLHRPEIERLLEDLPATDRSTPAYITDSTNLEDDYRRNFLRHRILPLLQTRWEGAHRAIQTSLHLLAEENKIIEKAIDTALSDADTLLTWDKLRNFPSPFTLIYRWISPIGGSGSQAMEMCSALGMEHSAPRVGGRWSIGDYEITAISAGLRRAKLTAGRPIVNVTEINITDSRREAIMKEVSEAGASTAYLPDTYDNYIWRKPHAAERMRIGKNMTKLISTILKESGVTAAARKNIYLLADRRTDKPVWIPGIRRGMDNRISGEEKIMTRIELA